jgi:hypothetical protein
MFSILQAWWLALSCVDSVVSRTLSRFMRIGVSKVGDPRPLRMLNCWVQTPSDVDDCTIRPRRHSQATGEMHFRSTETDIAISPKIPPHRLSMNHTEVRCDVY